MQLIVPFAAASSEAALEAAARLELPTLAALLAHADEGVRDDGEDWSLSPPHERALARAWGWQGGDGLLPFAARHAQADGIAPLDLAWGELTPAHWHVGTDQVSFIDPEALRLDEADSRALFEAVLPLFVEEGFALAWGAPLRWYAAHEALADCPTASLDRVIGRGVERWWPRPEAGLPARRDVLRRLRRLQNEAQMLLHGDAANERREAQGLLPVNSFWISGCGRHQSAHTADEVHVDERLRSSALGEDWAGWMQAWRELDDGPLRTMHAHFERGDASSRLTLCGTRSAVTYSARPRRWWQRLAAARHATPPEVLHSL